MRNNLSRCRHYAEAVFGLSWVLVSVTASAQSATRSLASEPIWVENLSPIASLVALPSQRSAVIKEGWRFDSHLAIASHWVLENNAVETLAFDGETTRLSLAMEYGFSDRWSVRLTAPWVQQDAGFLDGWINDWHDVFGMTDGGRSGFPEDRFRYAYSGAETSFEQTSTGSGLGDLRVEINHGFYRRADQAASLSLGYKAPTGNEARWLGSGAGDVYSAVRFSGLHRGNLPLTWHMQLGYTYAGAIEPVAGLDKRNIVFAGLGFDWRLNSAWSLLAQYDSHSAIVDSDLDAVGRHGGLLSFAARWRLHPDWAVDISFTEDIPVETSPDITFQATLRWRPQGGTHSD